MKTKMGRPRLPEGLSQRAQIGVRFKPSQEETIERDINGTTQTKADWVRHAAYDKMQAWVNCKFSAAELDGKSVEFRLFDENQIEMRGSGKFAAMERGDGKLKIKIETRKKDGPLTEISYIRIRPESAAWIKRVLPPSRRDFSCFDPTITNVNSSDSSTDISLPLSGDV